MAPSGPRRVIPIGPSVIGGEAGGRPGLLCDGTCELFVDHLVDRLVDRCVDRLIALGR
jgi:hypothetical protein